MFDQALTQNPQDIEALNGKGLNNKGWYNNRAGRCAQAFSGLENVTELETGHTLRMELGMHSGALEEKPRH